MISVRISTGSVVISLQLSMAILLLAPLQADAGPQIGDLGFSPSQSYRELRRSGMEQSAARCTLAMMNQALGRALYQSQPKITIDEEFESYVIPTPSESLAELRDLAKAFPDGEARIQQMIAVRYAFNGIEYHPELDEAYGTPFFYPGKSLIPKPPYILVQRQGVIRDGTPWYLSTNPTYVYDIALSEAPITATDQHHAPRVNMSFFSTIY